MARFLHGLPLGLGFLLLAGCGDDSGNESGGAGGGGGGGGGVSGGASGGGVSGGGGKSTASGGDGGSSGGSAGSSSSGGSAGSAGSGPGGPTCGAVTTFETGLEPETILHVAVTGSASATGSEDDPFDSIASAVGSAAPGTAIRVHSGNYDGDLYLDGLAGTADAPIWIGGAPDEDPPVIGSAAFGQAFQLVAARYVVVHDLVIEGTTGNGINADDGGETDNPDAFRYVVFRDLEIRDIGTGGNNDCLKLSGANDFWVLDSEFSNCSLGGSGIDMVGCHDGLIVGNEFASGGNAVQTKGGSENVEVRANRFVQSGGRAVNIGGSTGYEFFRPPLSETEDNAEARDIRVVANVFDRPEEALVFVGCVDCLAANNTVYLPSMRIIRILQETESDATYTFLPAGESRVVNNVFFFTRAEVTDDYRAINVGAGTAPETFEYTNNLWYASDDVAGSEPAAGAYSGAAVSGSPAPEDPAFADAPAGNFAIDAASPVVGAGVDLPEVPSDYVGACYAMPRALGAFEAP